MRLFQFSFILFIFSMNIFSQDISDQKSLFWNNVQFGGGINLNFSNQYTTIGVSPSALYNFNDKFATGVSVSYLYSKKKNISEPLNVYGAGVLARYKPIDALQFSSEFEENFLKQGNLKQTIPALYLGAGYNVNRNISAGIRYDVLYNKDKSIYPSAITPFVRVYF